MLQKSKYFFCSIICLCWLWAGSAQAQTSSYQELQAAYIFNFAKYITWPGQQDTFVIGIYNEDDMKAFFEKSFAGRTIRGKPIELRVIKRKEEIFSCRIIFIPKSRSKDIKIVTSSAEGGSTLIVTEEDLIKKGATISFVVEDNRLKFKLKKTALLHAQLSASEGLLKLAILE
jgi:hypothetical protein